MVNHRTLIHRYFSHMVKTSSLGVAVKLKHPSFSERHSFHLGRAEQSLRRPKQSQILELCSFRSTLVFGGLSLIEIGL